MAIAMAMAMALAVVVVVVVVFVLMPSPPLCLFFCPFQVLCAKAYGFKWRHEHGLSWFPLKPL
jgi:hypothetical protein